jgi:hypothetical protein
MLLETMVYIEAGAMEEGIAGKDKATAKAKIGVTMLTQEATPAATLSTSLVVEVVVEAEVAAMEVVAEEEVVEVHQ